MSHEMIMRLGKFRKRLEIKLEALGVAGVRKPVATKPWPDKTSQRASSIAIAQDRLKGDQRALLSHCADI